MTFKPIAGPKLVTIGRGAKVRDIQFPPAPVRVSEAAQAIPIDINTVRQFNFSQESSSAVACPVATSLPERPSTSGGPGTTSNFSLRRNFEKRETRDDLYFDVTREQTTFYNFPLPGSLPTPTESLRSVYTPPPRHSSLPRSLTPDSIDMSQHMEAPQMEIGMALGSPTHQPVGWQGQNYQSLRNPSPETFQDSIYEPIIPTPVKQKSKWKMFGGLFGGTKKNNSVQAQNFYQVQTGEATPDVDVISEEPKKPVHPNRARTNSERKVGKTKPTVKRAHTAPIVSEQRPKTAPSNRNPEILLDGHQIEEDCEPRTMTGLMLNVDIPSVEMERYSIMFGSLLSQKQVQGNSNSSLLARRQATLDRLKTVNEELALKEKEIEERTKHIKQPRRATSPQPRGSPVFSLFPSTPGRDARSGRTPSPSGRQTTLHRSNTSPAALSPSRPTFAPGPGNEIHATLMEPGPHIPDSYETDDSTVDVKSSRVAKSIVLNRKQVPVSGSNTLQATSSFQPQSAVRTFTPDQSHLSLSPDSDDDIYEDRGPSSTRAKISTTAWRVESKHSAESVSGSATSESEHSKSASGSSISTSSSTTPYSASSLTQKHNVRQSPLNQNATNAKIPTSKMNNNPPQVNSTRTRTRSATTSGSAPTQLPRPVISTQKSVEITHSAATHSTRPSNQSTPNLHKASSQSKLNEQNDTDRENEERLKNLADVSIARQISVSRQQRQLLIPIKGSLSKKSPSIEPSTTSSPKTTPQSKRTRSATTSAASPIPTSSTISSPSQHNNNFPSPLQTRDRDRNNLTPLNVSRVTSPLSAVEIATKEEKRSLDREAHNLQRQESNLVKSKVPGIVIKGTERREREERERERLVDGVKAGSPRLVIVGDENVGTGISEKLSIAERRRKAKGDKAGTGLGSAEGRLNEHRKSERVVFERVS